MAIGPIELTGMVTRTQDFSTMKQNADNKIVVDNMNIQNQIDKSVHQKATTVKHADDSDYRENHYDAKEKGNGQYSGDGGKRRNSDNESSGTERVSVKRTGGFDIKI